MTNAEKSQELLDALMADPEQRARLEKMATETTSREPVPDDFEWLNDGEAK